MRRCLARGVIVLMSAMQLLPLLPALAGFGARIQGPSLGLNSKAAWPASNRTAHASVAGVVTLHIAMLS